MRLRDLTYNSFEERRRHGKILANDNLNIIATAHSDLSRSTHVIIAIIVIAANREQHHKQSSELRRGHTTDVVQQG